MNIWVMVKNTDNVSLSLKEEGSGMVYNQVVATSSIKGFKKYTPVTFRFSALKAQTDYSYEIKLDDEIIKGKQPLSTAKKELQDFSFLLGSCAYVPPIGLRFLHPGIEERVYPYMTDKSSDFMIWLGDYLYYFKRHYKSFSGMYRKQVNTRESKKMGEFLFSRPQYSIWDDHDYGSNNSTKDFELKEEALELFKLFWPNPSFGTFHSKGNFSYFSYLDADFFLTDNRWYRDHPEDSLGVMLGSEQMDWLKERLSNSKATFKFLCIGTETLSTKNPKESFQDYEEELADLLNFLQEQNITGVIFLTGDRHHSELMKLDRPGAYPLYEFSSSPITSFRRKTSKTEENNNPERIPGTLIDYQNFGRISITGEVGNRQCLLETFDKRGELLWEFRISEGELR